MTKKYLEFVLKERRPKTLVYSVRSTSTGDELGVIHWHPRWKRYTLRTPWDVEWAAGCLDEVSAFIGGLMEARR